MTPNYLQPKQILYGFKLPSSDLLRAGQVAETLECTPEHIYNLIHSEALKAVSLSLGKSSSVYRIPRANFAAFIEERTTGPRSNLPQDAEILHGLVLPAGRILKTGTVADFLRCTPEHIYNLAKTGELLAMDISCPGKHHISYRFPRIALIQFINARIEGDN